MDSKQLGQMGENKAADFLKSKGYEIICQNFRTKFGEIDIIARDKQAYVFVEVKTRSNIQYGTPAEAITRDKLKRIQRLIGNFVSTYQIESPIRFEVVTIIRGQTPKLIKEVEFIDR